MQWKKALNIALPCLALLCLALAQSNLFYTFFTQAAYVRGLLIDYLLPKLYLFDVSLVGMLLVDVWIRASSPHRTNALRLHPLFRVLCVVICLRFLLQTSISGWWWCAQLAGIFAFGLIFWTRRGTWFSSLLFMRALSIVFASIVLLQSAIGWMQFWRQSSLFPSYVWGGETRLSSYAGIARGDWGGRLFILPYGTTAHPNVWAGIIVLSSFGYWFSTQEKSKKIMWTQWLLIGCAGVAVILAQSLSAFVCLLCAALAHRVHTHTWHIAVFIVLVVPLGLCVAQQIPLLAELPSIQRRAVLQQEAFRMIVTSPLFGTGFGGFVQHLDSTREREIVRFVQPVHHVGLLWLVETGIIWNVAVCGVLFFLFRKHRRRAAEYMQRGGAILLILSPLLALDHYLLTNPGASLIAITWAMVMVTVQEKSVTKETA